MVKVLLLNDDFTPAEFVIHVLQQVFEQSRETATQLMIATHRDGTGVCGSFSRDEAVAKVTQARELAKQKGHPLQCTIEQE